MMADYLQIQGECRDGLCVLRVTGELDASMADEFAGRAAAVVRAMPGPVVVDLSGLAFIDASGVRALAAAIQTLPCGRWPAIRSCPPHIRRVLDLLGLPPDYLAAGIWIAPESETFQLVDRVRHARLYASEAKLDARLVLSRLADTCIRLASTRERIGLTMEQGRRTVASSRAVRELSRGGRGGFPGRG